MPEFGESRFNEHYHLLQSNRSFYAYKGAISIGPDLVMRYGWDGSLPEFIRDESKPIETDLVLPPEFTMDEIIEICTVMISRWERLRKVAEDAEDYARTVGT